MTMELGVVRARVSNEALVNARVTKALIVEVTVASMAKRTKAMEKKVNDLRVALEEVKVIDKEKQKKNIILISQPALPQLKSLFEMKA